MPSTLVLGIDNGGGFFALPRKARDAIYKEVLSVSHPLYLFQDTPSYMGVFAPEVPPHWLALLYTNRQASRESSAVLYAKNVFAFVDQAEEQTSLLRRFFTSIGPVNSSFLTRLCIDFPAFPGRPEGPELRRDSQEGLKLVRDHCVGLTTIEFSLNSLSSRKLTSMVQGEKSIAQEAIAQIRSSLQSMPSLQEVYIRLQGTRPPDFIVQIMRDCDWIVTPAHGIS
ncbi:hypothetical protein B9Z65_6972 [Elsinoe australis]|uniref:Uncharacterized protein n=1 Tax=Elsinoe australis TaxID=40998 RepID=A0A2P7Z470_9PEZI|nr:hypothetical protein B9Z65_6972 [Elsinoe australis]